MFSTQNKFVVLPLERMRILITGRNEARCGRVRLGACPSSSPARLPQWHVEQLDVVAPAGWIQDASPSAHQEYPLVASELRGCLRKRRHVGAGHSQRHLERVMVGCHLRCTARLGASAATWAYERR